MHITNKAIAKQLKVSETTLSFIINNKPGIAEKTRSRVIKELKARGYDHLLRRETKAPAKNICFIVYKRHGGILNQSPFYLLLMEQIEDRAKSSGYNLVVRTMDPTDGVEDEIKELNGSAISGIIIFATEMLDDDMERFKHAAIPVVSLDNDFTHLEMDSVVINNRVGTLRAVEHLVEAGHKHIGYLQCKTFINSFGGREAGYTRALGKFGLKLNSKHIFKLGYTEEESYRNFKAILSSGVKLPTAFVSDDDTISVGALRALEEAGVSVPDDISLVGFNDRPVCLHTRPQLTSISVPKGMFGSLAVDLLVNRIMNHVTDNSDYRKVEVGVQLAVRGTTGCPR